MSNISASDSRSAVLACISAQFTLYFDGRFWVGVLEHHERHRGVPTTRPGRGGSGAHGPDGVIRTSSGPCSSCYRVWRERAVSRVSQVPQPRAVQA